MELTPIDGGRRSGANEPVTSALAPFSVEIAETLSYLAHLIDDEIELRGVGTSVREFAASYLRTPLTNVVVTTRELGVLDFQLCALAFAADIERHEPGAIIGSDQEEPPQWERLSFGDHDARVPVELAAGLAAGSICRVPLVVEIGRVRGQLRGFKAYSRSEDSPHAEKYLSKLCKRARKRTNPFRGKALETAFGPMGLTLRVKAVPETNRLDVVLPSRIWAEVDRNIHGFFAGFDELARAGLARNRGVLLSGPPGTGKTALCRVLANEVVGDATVVFCDATTVAHGLRQLYAEVTQLAPALVVMEDVDLIVRNRGAGGGHALMEFLVTLDGAMSTHAGVVTIATTNDSNAIDPAAKRSARFDVEVEVPPPNVDGRAAILERYLRDLDVPVDVPAVAAATDGATGADLRELVSNAVLYVAEAARVGGENGAQTLDTELLLRLARPARSRTNSGFYL